LIFGRIATFLFELLFFATCPPDPSCTPPPLFAAASQLFRTQSVLFSSTPPPSQKQKNWLLLANGNVLPPSFLQPFVYHSLLNLFRMVSMALGTDFHVCKFSLVTVLSSLVSSHPFFRRSFFSPVPLLFPFSLFSPLLHLVIVFDRGVPFILGCSFHTGIPQVFVYLPPSFLSRFFLLAGVGACFWRFSSAFPSFFLF